jgi:hypothetical protein
MIIWQSARPIRFALARLHGVRFDDHAPEGYELAVLLPGLTGALKPNLTLSWRGHTRIGPLAVTPPAKDGQAWLFHFAAAPPLRLEDGSVTVNLRVGDHRARARFKLASMVYQGRLEL